MTVFVFDQTPAQTSSLFAPFAVTDVLTEEVGVKEDSFLHFWQLPSTLILGMKDMRVPYLQEALKAVNHLGYHTIVRNSGGLGVIADDGVLNISYIFKKNEQIHLTDEAYVLMYQLTQKAFPELEIDAFEIHDSYCPGTYDLSVNGKKIAGIAQRRVKNGIAVMMYLSVNGDQSKRGEIVKNFYQHGLVENFGQDGYPPVNPDSMTTVSQVLNKKIAIHDVKERFTVLFERRDTIKNLGSWLTEENADALFLTKEKNMVERNNQIKEFLHDNSL